MTSSRLAFALRTHRFEAIVVFLACALIVAAPSPYPASVSEIVSGSTDPASMPTAIPSGLPLTELQRLRPQAGSTRYAIDLLTQAPPGAPQAGIAVAPPAPLSVAAQAPLTVAGWAIDVQARTSAASIFVTVDGRAIASCPISIARPDVARALASAAYVSSGFSCTVPARAMTPGRHRLSLAVVTRRHTFYRADVARETIVR